MARKTPSRMELRKQAEAAKTRGDGAKKRATKKKTTTTRTRRTKDKVPQRRRLFWAVFNPAMKEEARFPYDQRAAAEEKLKQLRAKNDKPYFIQPIKEPIVEAPPAEAEAAPAAKSK